jgi:hypothetical protein
MVKDEEVFMPFWLEYYTRFFGPQDLYVYSDGSTDNTEGMCRSVGVNFHPIVPGTVQVGKNDRYIKSVITQLLERYECVLFAESPDDIIVPGPAHNHNLSTYLDDFIASSDRYRFLTGINIIQGPHESPYDHAKGTLLSQRQIAVRCNQYDNAFLWKDTPLWGRGWHDLGGKRLCGMGDVQGEDKRLYNLHIHYADFDLCNRRHQARQRTYSDEQKQAYSSRVDGDLRSLMFEMVTTPAQQFSEGKLVPIESWMQRII